MIEEVIYAVGMVLVGAGILVFTFAMENGYVGF